MCEGGFAARAVSASMADVVIGEVGGVAVGDAPAGSSGSSMATFDSAGRPSSATGAAASSTLARGNPCSAAAEAMA